MPVSVTVQELVSSMLSGMPVTVAGVARATSEQVLAWIGRPALKNNIVTLTIKEEVAKATATNVANYDFTPETVQVTQVKYLRVETDSKSGIRKTVIQLILRAPLLSPTGVKLAVHNLESVHFQIEKKQLDCAGRVDGGEIRRLGACLTEETLGRRLFELAAAAHAIAGWLCIGGPAGLLVYVLLACCLRRRSRPRRRTAA